MTSVRRHSLFVSLAGAIALLMQISPVLAAPSRPRPFEVDFNKCFNRFGDAPYVVTFAGTVSGDVSGTLEARVATLVPGVEPGQTYIQADYVIAGTLAFTARVGGRAHEVTNLAVLRGFVSDGPAWLLGAGVHDEFENYVLADGTPCSKGTLYITPRWKQTHNDDDQ